MDTQDFIKTRINMRQAAIFLGVSISQIRKATSEGRLAHFKIGNRFYYLETDLLSLIQRVEPHNNGNINSLL